MPAEQKKGRWFYYSLEFVYSYIEELDTYGDYTDFSYTWMG
jgi:hypothetical protein